MLLLHVHASASSAFRMDGQHLIEFGCSNPPTLRFFFLFFFSRRIRIERKPLGITAIARISTFLLYLYREQKIKNQILPGVISPQSHPTKASSEAGRTGIAKPLPRRWIDDWPVSHRLRRCRHCSACLLGLDIIEKLLPSPHSWEGSRLSHFPLRFHLRAGADRRLVWCDVPGQRVSVSNHPGPDLRFHSRSYRRPI